MDEAEHPQAEEDRAHNEHRPHDETAGEGERLAQPAEWQAALCLLTAGLMRSRLGLPLGWLCQALTIASGLVVGTMFIVGAIFLGLWVLCLVQGAKVERMMAAREATA